MARRRATNVDVEVPEEFRLTEYERNRKPHEPVMDDTVVTLGWKDLDAEMQCPVCREILSDTVTTKDCLHRFCSECMTRALRTTKKACPTCRKECPTHRSLRQDDTLNKLISIIFPDRSILEAQHEQLMEKIHKYSNSNAAMSVYNEGTKAQTDPHQRPGPVKRGRTGSGSAMDRASSDDSRPGPKRRKSDDSAGGGGGAGGAANVVELEFKVHPRESKRLQISHKYLTTTADCSMAHLAKYLESQLTGSDRMESPSFYTEGCHGYFKWKSHDSLRTVMDWRIKDKIASMRPKDPFTIYYAASSKLETEGVRRR